MFDISNMLSHLKPYKPERYHLLRGLLNRCTCIHCGLQMCEIEVGVVMGAGYGVSKPEECC